MNSKNIWRFGLVASTMLLAALLLWLPTSGAQASTTSQQTTYSGQATVVQASVLGLPPIVLSDTGPLPPEGGAKESSLLTASVDGTLTAEVLHASSVGQGDQSRSEASVANLSLALAGNSIAADFLMARATAQCRPGGASAAGQSEVVGLLVNGQTISISGQPNQTVLLPGGRLIINEQQPSQNKRTAEITVNALHIVLDGVADVVISSAHADISCGMPVCPGGDFVTGGGWVPGTPSGAKGNFGAAGG